MRLLLIILLFCSCNRTIYYGIGMSQNDFLERNKGKGLLIEEDSQERTVYKRCNEAGCAFFYFRDGKLYQMDKGRQAPDIIVERR